MKGKEDGQVKSCGSGRMDQEAVHTNEVEKMLKEHAEAAAQELSRKKSETSEAREKNEAPETQRNKKKSEACQEDVEKDQNEEQQ